jgi:hypothetical protein
VTRKNFDIYVGVDWSGAKAPLKTNSVALSWCYTGSSKPEYIKEKISRQDVFNWILDISKLGKSMLIGIDCNFSYAHHFTHKQFGKDFRINHLWSEVENLNSQNDNFYAGGIWESQKYKGLFWTEGDKPDWYDENILRRKTEKLCKDLKLGNPECPFKLIGAKQVGKGGLSGMRLAHHLMHQIGDHLSIWPFNADLERASIVMAEIYPRLFLNYCGFGNKKIREMNDLNLALMSLNSEIIQSRETLNDHVSDAIVSAAGLRFFVEKLAPSISDAFHIEDEYKDIARNEGWIFGVNKVFLQEK